MMLILLLQTLSELLTDYEEVLSECVSAGKIRATLGYLDILGHSFF